MKKISLIVIIFILFAALYGCGKVAHILSASSKVTDTVISTIKSVTDSEDVGGMDGESIFDPSEETQNSEPDEMSGTDNSAEDEISVSDPEETEPDADSSTRAVLDFLKSGNATIGDLKAMNLSSLKASPSLLLDVFLSKDIEKNAYSNKLFRHEGDYLYYNDPEYDCLLGIDVSFFQGEIDWEAIKAQGISFAFIRIGFRGYGETGSLNEDPMFRQNLEGAKQAGLLVGGYFFSQAMNEEEAIEEAQYAISLLEGASLDLPLVFDAEFIKDDETRLDNTLLSQFTKNALAFCQSVESAGYSAMIYTNLLWEGLIYDLSQLSDYPIWYADYNPMPLTPYQFDFWQYTESGWLEGIEEPVDLNLWMRK